MKRVGPTQARGGDGLIATLPTVVAIVASARDGLSRVGKVGHARDKVDVDRADHDYAAAHLWCLHSLRRRPDPRLHLIVRQSE